MSDHAGKTAAKPTNSDRIRALQDQIADLKQRWPAHSTPAALMQRLDDLEEQLEIELAAANPKPKP